MRNVFPMKGLGLTYSEMQGLTKREYFAATILASLCAKPGNYREEELITWAIETADALIDALSKVDTDRNLNAKEQE